MPSLQHDVLHLDVTPELSLEVLGLSLGTRNCTEDERQHLRTQCEHTDKPHRHGLLLVSPEAHVEAASLYLLVHCRIGHHGPKQSFVSREEARNT